MIQGLTADFEKRFANGPLIQAAFQLPVDGFSITVLFGPSGSGKTTILRCLAGLEHPDRGCLQFRGETWFDADRRVFLPPQRRKIGYFFQDYALFPHLTALGNVRYGLDSLPGGDRDRRAREILDRVGLRGLENRYPKQLSGGQQQRVALGRVLAGRPRLLLLDEPLSALDEPSRDQLRRELRRLLAEIESPALIVTHDRVEALALGDAVLVLHDGRICQQGPVHDVFGRPASPEVARIVGVETIELASVQAIADGLATVVVGPIRLVALDREARVGPCYACIRAEDVTLEKGAEITSSARNRLPGRVRDIALEGPMVRVTLDCGFVLTALITNQSRRELDIREGDQVTALIKAPAVHLISRC